jgi:molybdenum cofactor cytidylyltransferase
MTDNDPGGDLPLLDRATVEATSQDSRAGGVDDRTAVAGVLLAAGQSDRFGGSNKLLAELGGEPLVTRAGRSLTDADLDRVVAVVGHEADCVRDALADLPLSVVENPHHARGQATSVRTGVHAVEDADAAVFGLADMPLVDPETVVLLVAAFRAGLGDPLAAAHRGRRGNPVLFGARHFDALADVEGDTGGRAILLESDDAALVETGDPGVHEDVDSPADLERLRDG